MNLKCLYVDNFRGFTKTTLPLRAVNFLVGENSTGKSSILGLITIIEDIQSFWVQPAPRFDSSEIDFGNFDDIVSINSKDKSYFRVGTLTLNEKNGEYTATGFLATFKQKEGRPTIRRYTCFNQGKQIDFKFGNTNISYKYQEPTHVTKCDLDEANKVFMAWSNQHEARANGYKVIPKDTMPTSLIALNSLIGLGLQKKEDLGQRLVHFQVFNLFNGVKWIAPIRSKPKRTYDLYSTQYSPTGEHTPYLIKKYFNSRKTRKAFLNFIEEYGKNSGLFEGIGIRNYAKGLTSPFELDIKIGLDTFRVTDVGYGVSQVLPIIVELFGGGPGRGYFIQQPEIHLHPRAQAALGDMIYKFAAHRNIKFAIETHSDYIIDRFRTAYGNDDKKMGDIDAQVVFFQHTLDGNLLYTIDIDQHGELSDAQPKEYREFFLTEQMKLLRF